MLLVPLLLWLNPPRHSGDKNILAVIGSCLPALLYDFMDHQIAALAIYWVVVRLRRRRIL